MSKFGDKCRRDTYSVLESNCIIEVCSVCDEPSDLETDIPCRVCGTVYHKSCLSNCGHYTGFDMKIAGRANTILGWSCSICDNIAEFLDAEELMAISDKFERLDINKDEVLSCEEYLMFR